MDLKVETEDRGAITVVTMSGDIDVYAAPLVRDSLDRQVSLGRHHLVVDVQAVTFMDSTALGVLVGRLKIVRMQRGTLRVVCTVPRILRVFGITGLDKVFPIHTSIDEAVEAAQAEIAPVASGSSLR